MRRRLEQFLRLLAPLLPPLLELPRLLLTAPLLQLPPRLLSVLLLLFLLLLLDGAKPRRPGRPPRNERSLGLLVRRPGIRRSPVAARPVTYGDRIPLDPRSGRLGGSLLSLGPRRLSLFWRRRGRLTLQGAGRGTLGASRWLRVGGAYKTKNKGQSL